MVRLKIGHTARVAANMQLLTTELDLPEGISRKAQAIAWLHDVGRFPQLERYGTLNDRESVDHAVLGLQVIAENRILEGLSGSVQSVIRTAVANHNRLEVESDLNDRTMLFCNLIRDADKIDIERVIRTSDEEVDADGKSPALFNLPEEPYCSQLILEDVQAGRLARMENMSVRNDFRLVALAWVFNLNFAPSFRILKERGHLEYLAQRLPNNPETASAVKRVMQALDDGIKL